AISLLNLRPSTSRETVDIGGLLSGRDAKLSDLYLNRGVCYMNSPPPALSLPLALLDLNRSASYKGRPDPVILVNRGVCLDYLGEYALAVEDFKWWE
ncbi:hypothetical protein TrRE_jg3803, partial [Triparma retinervis]